MPPKLIESLPPVPTSLIVSVAPEKVTRMVRLHVEANARLVRAALPAMKAAGYGAIILVSSLRSHPRGRRPLAGR